MRIGALTEPLRTRRCRSAVDRSQPEGRQRLAGLRTACRMGLEPDPRGGFAKRILPDLDKFMAAASCAMFSEIGRLRKALILGAPTATHHSVVRS